MFRSRVVRARLASRGKVNWDNGGPERRTREDGTRFSAGVRRGNRGKQTRGGTGKKERVKQFEIPLYKRGELHFRPSPLFRELRTRVASVVAVAETLSGNSLCPDSIYRVTVSVISDSLSAATSAYEHARKPRVAVSEKEQRSEGRKKAGWRKVQPCRFHGCHISRETVECESRSQEGAIRRLAFVDAALSPRVSYAENARAVAGTV